MERPVTPLACARLRVALSLAATLGLALSLPVAAQVQPGTTQAVPSHAYVGDRVGIPLYLGTCGSGSALDPDAPPRVTTVSHEPNQPDTEFDDVYHHRIEYGLLSSDPICGTPPPAGFREMTDIGALPPGLHTFEVEAFVGGTLYAGYEVSTLRVGQRDRPGPEVSGAWYAPSQSGRGVLVTRAQGMTTVYWATHDRDGNPDWVLMVPEQDDNTITGLGFNTAGAPLAPGAATLSEQPWGTLTFSYLGCGRARLAWDADDEAIEDGEIELVQLAGVDGVPSCAPKPDAVVAVWDDAE